MIYKVHHPIQPKTDKPGPLISYINICNSETQNYTFIYQSLMLNKIIPDGWYDLKELTFSSGYIREGDYRIRRRASPLALKTDVLYMVPLEQITQNKKSRAERAKYDLGEMRFVFNRVAFQPIADYRAYAPVEANNAQNIEPRPIHAEPEIIEPRPIQAEPDIDQNDDVIIVDI